MNRKEAEFVAKKIFVENIYNLAYMEGCNVTYLQTQTILDLGVTSGVAVSDIQTVLNLRNAWRLMLNTLDKPLDLELISKINYEISREESLEWGVLRSGNVSISGTDYVPPIPVQKDIELHLYKIKQIQNAEERAYNLFAFLCKSQLFWDGNKRTAMVCMNKILIEEGIGVSTISPKYSDNFNSSLKKYYDSGDSKDLFNVLKEGLCFITYPKKTDIFE